jgi:predicted nucleotidyltransferase
MSNPVMREICYLLMAGLDLSAARDKLKLSLMAFEMFLDEIKRRLIEAGLEIRRA